MFTFLIFFFSLVPPSHSSPYLLFNPKTASLVAQENLNFSVSASEPLDFEVSVKLKASEYLRLSHNLVIYPNEAVSVAVTAIFPINQVFLEIESCFVNGTAECPLDFATSFARLRIVRSRLIDILVDLAGWGCFLAWGISFWPQMMMNFRRKSVSGLNFDFLLLNTIGFLSYTVYNCLIFFDSDVQSAYFVAFPRSPLPVLLTDIVLSGHALIAGSNTGAQAIFLDRGDQRVSRLCIILSSVLVACGAIAGLLTLANLINLLAFVTSLSYIKMVVTLSKYFPQAVMNYRRQTTVGWSVGNVLLDFFGGVLSLLQMGLQGYNVGNFSAIIGNPVKFGIGFVSIAFDCVFIVQHYVLYRDAQECDYEVLDDTQASDPEHEARHESVNQA